MTAVYASEYFCESCHWHGDEPDLILGKNRCPLCGDELEQPEPAPARPVHQVDAQPSVCITCPSCAAKLELNTPVQINFNADLGVERLVGAKHMEAMREALQKYADGCKAGTPDRFFAEDNARPVFEGWLAHIAANAVKK